MTTGTPTPSRDADPAEPRSGGPTLGRRAAIAGAGAAALGVVAACGSGGSAGSGGQSGLPEGAPGTVLGPTSDVPVGGGAVFSGQQVVVTQPAPGRYQGLSAICPHQGCSVNAVQDGEVVCPCHGSRFGLDGAVLQGPAESPLARRAVTVQGTNITLA